MVGVRSIDIHAVNMDCRFSERKTAIHIACILLDGSLVPEIDLCRCALLTVVSSKKAIIFDLLLRAGGKAPITKEYALVPRGVVLSRVVATPHKPLYARAIVDSPRDGQA